MCWGSCPAHVANPDPARECRTGHARSVRTFPRSPAHCQVDEPAQMLTKLKTSRLSAATPADHTWKGCTATRLACALCAPSLNIVPPSSRNGYRRLMCGGHRTNALSLSPAQAKQLLQLHEKRGDGPMYGLYALWIGSISVNCCSHAGWRSGAVMGRGRRWCTLEAADLLDLVPHVSRRDDARSTAVRQRFHANAVTAAPTLPCSGCSRAAFWPGGTRQPNYACASTCTTAQHVVLPSHGV